MVKDVQTRRKRILARIFGNFGVSFFTPLVSANVAESIFDVGLNFQESILVAFISAVFTVGLMLSREVKEFGEKSV